MAKKFLYFIAICIVIVIGGRIAYELFDDELAALALVPSAEFTPTEPLMANAYADPALWLSRPGMGTTDPARWQPALASDRGLLPTPADPSVRPFAVFFVHPTSYINRERWNAPLANGGDPEAERIARIYLRGMASPFNGAKEIWAPRYRQATFGAFLTDQAEAQQALDAAYGDVEQAFAAFVAETDPGTPIVLAGHSQGTLHLLRLLKEEISGTPLAARVAAVYAVGWPVSIQHDLPALGLPPCSSQNQPGCIMSWSSFAEPADPSPLLETYAGSTGFDGAKRGTSPILCTNPLTGGAESAAPATLNLGTLKPDGDLSNGSLVTAAVPARCDTRGLLLIGDPPEMGRYVLPGNNYHVYDIPLFWANVQFDVARRVEAWAKRP